MTDITDIDNDDRRRRKRKAPVQRPRLGTIEAPEKYAGIGRTKLYEEAARHSGLFVKWDAATRVNFDLLDEIIDALPDAQIKAPSK
jgi:hypothetical protein